MIRFQGGVLAGDLHLFLCFNLKVKGKICCLPACVSFQRWKVEVGVGFCTFPACDYLHECLRGVGLL